LGAEPLFISEFQRIDLIMNQTAPSSSLEKMLSIIDLVEDAQGGLTSDVLLTLTGLTRSTLYRYLKILSDAGFLTSLPGGGVTLGPRVVELDYKMRLRDPLIIAGRPVMVELVKAIPGIALLCRQYKDKVLCVHQETAGVSFNSSYERGHARPLLLGSASRIILAFSPPRTIKRLFDQYTNEFKAAGIGATHEEAREFLAAIRAQGWDMTCGQVTVGVTGIAAPILDSNNQVVGSLSVTLGKSRLDPKAALKTADHIRLCAGIVSQTLNTPAPA